MEFFVNLFYEDCSNTFNNYEHGFEKQISIDLQIKFQYEQR